MKKLIWIIPVTFFFLSCKGLVKKQDADQNKLSVLIFHDSVLIYNGVFHENIGYKKYLHTEPEKLKQAIEQNRRKYGSQSEILLKIANEKSSSDPVILIQYLGDILMQNRGPDLKIDDVTKTEEYFFNIFPFRKSMWDSLNEPLPYDLYLPNK